MPGINEVNLTPEQKAADKAGQEAREDAFAEKLVQSLDLPASLSEAIEEGHKKEKAKPKEEIVTEEELDKEESEEQSEETSDNKNEDTDTESNSKEDDDLIPRSKVQKRIDQLTRERIQLESRIRQLEEKEEAVPKDDEMAKLEAMNETELKAIKRQVRIAQAKSASDDDKLSKLVDLEEKVDTVLRTAPQKFQSSQISKFYEAVKETSSEINDFEKSGKEIFVSAKSIFDSSPELQKSVTGQARAWKLAVEHHQELSKVNAGKSKNEDLERKVNNLKKKVGMDSGSAKVPSADETENKLFQKAKYGTEQDKVAFVRKRLNTDSLIPEEYLSR